MYLKIQQFLPRYLELFQKTIKKFSLELNVVTKKGKNKISNFAYYQNFEKNYEFLVVDEHKQADFIFAFFVLSRKGQTFYLNLPFFSQFLDKNWINIIGEFILDFIEENYHFEAFYVQISNLDIKINNFFQKFAISFDDNSNTFKFNLVKRYEFIDIHCHPFSEYFQDSKAQVDNWFKKNIGLIFIVGTSWEYLEEIKKIGNYSKKIYKIIGIHPTLVAENDNFSLLENHIDDKVLAIGEVGLDFYYENNPPKEVQIKALLDQIQIAKSKKIPVMLHIRDKSGENQAMKLISEIVTKFSEINFIFHNFSTNYEIFQKLVKKNNCFFSFSGVITFKKSIELRRIIKETPLEKIFTETDVPYLSPEPNRQLWPNVSPQIQWTYQTIANLKNLTKIELSEIIYRNIRKIFKVKNAKTGS
ncbi:TatD family deoxyribonuclease [Mycoplasma hyopneumoniae]|uniref:TatD family hydrolase n=1 Tax=Mesomycoplasma hyopneumoniae TaxID=2099 RepID=UPI0013685AEE|nr:TatD family hydrolase [Mesomycoplasma hyopneumoniae]MXR10956.1 TatD family deoxyribonuclease [Mesomycoplasma hyopneumoniae]MXR63785.1 TatD family deoxyribonuclease [Mesomycoplasma hyopneumoniae]